MQSKPGKRKKKELKCVLEVEYVDMTPEQRKLWLQRLVKFYDFWESIQVDELTAQKQLEKPIDQSH